MRIKKQVYKKECFTCERKFKTIYRHQKFCKTPCRLKAHYYRIMELAEKARRLEEAQS